MIRLTEAVYEHSVTLRGVFLDRIKKKSFGLHIAPIIRNKAGMRKVKNHVHTALSVAIKNYANFSKSSVTANHKQPC